MKKRGQNARLRQVIPAKGMTASLKMLTALV